MNTLQFIIENKIGIVQLDRGRSNAINLEMLQELQQLFNDLAINDEVDGVILTGKEGFFSAGLDVIELYDYDNAKISELFETLFATMRSMIALPKPMIANINGHSPAGGCVLALCADYRVMTEGKYRIGLNEVPVGIIIPSYVYQSYAYWLGSGKANQFILEGKLLMVEEALSNGLINAISPVEQGMQMCKAQMQKYLSFSRMTWQKSKQVMRAEWLSYFEQLNPIEKENLLQQWWSDDTRQILGALVAKLSGK